MRWWRPVEHGGLCRARTRVEASTGASTDNVAGNVVLYNDDWHPFDQVVFQVQKATGCTLEMAIWITKEAHTLGRAIAFTGELKECERVAGVLRQIKLQVETDKAG